MGDCHLYHDEIRINVADPNVTKCWIYLRGEGDCPFQCVGWHYNEFPASVTSQDILCSWADGKINPISWPRMDPPPTVPNYTPDWDGIENDIKARMGDQGANANE